MLRAGRLAEEDGAFLRVGVAEADDFDDAMVLRAPNRSV
jgi:hypothetical protein